MQNEITLVSCSTCHLNWCNLQKTTQKRSKIAKMLQKRHIFVIYTKMSGRLNNVFSFYIKFLISGHPWHPWACQYNFCYCSGKDAGDIPHSEYLMIINGSISYTLNAYCVICNFRMYILSVACIFKQQVMLYLPAKYPQVSNNKANNDRGTG